MGELKEKVVKGALWVTIERFGTQAVDFVVGVIMARLLGPEEFGLVALTGIFFAVARSLIDCGLGLSLVQRKDTDELDFNTVFYASIAIALAVYAVLFLSAPAIASFYREPELVPIVRVMAVCLIFFGINSVQGSELVRKMLFDRECVVTLIVCLTGAVTGVTFAFLGWGAWALVWSGVITAAVGTVVRWFFIAWRPRWMFSFARFRLNFAFGWKMCAASLINQFFEQLRGMMIGRCYTKVDLSFVDKGGGIPQRAITAIDDTIGSVAFPALVRLQDEPDRMREAMRRMIQTSTFMVFPAMVFVAVCARPLVLLLFGPRWEPAVPYMRIICFSYALYPFSTVNLKGIMALGRSDVFLVLEVIKKTLVVIVLFTSLRYGVLAFVAASAFVLSPLAVMVNAWPNRKLLGYTIGMQVRDVLPTAAVCGAMAAAMCASDLALCAAGSAGLDSCGLLPTCGVLAVEGAVAGATYLLLARLFRLKALAECADVVAGFVRKASPAWAGRIERWFIG